MVALAQTPKDTLFRDGTASLYRFRPAPQAGAAAAGPVAVAGQDGARLPVLLVPSIINRWYVLDLRPGSSLAEALVARGLDVWCLDWGIPEDEDRYLGWDDLIDRLGRVVRKVQRLTGQPRVALLGYCVGATLAGIYAALEPDNVAGLVNLAGPFDFFKAGFLREMVDPAWFDAEAMTVAGNLSAQQMQSGFTSMRPTSQVGKWIGFAHTAHDPASRDAFLALEAWASDNIPFPGKAYTTYIGELYQQNLLIQGQHHVGGRRVDLGRITCPLLTIVTERDTICPPPAALGLEQVVGSTDKQVLRVPGGHVGAVVGRKASQTLYPAIARWLDERTQVTVAVAA